MVRVGAGPGELYDTRGLWWSWNCVSLNLSGLWVGCRGWVVVGGVGVI